MQLDFNGESLPEPTTVTPGDAAMSTLTKLALGAMGRLRPKPALGDAAPTIPLPPPDKAGGLPLMQALARRQSAREFATTELPLPLLSSLLWAANGINRDDGRHTAPSAMNAQEIDVYVALPSGAYLYQAAANELRLAAGSDVRRVTGYQDFVDEAPLDLVYVADHSRMKLIPVGMRESYACTAAGAITQNVYLFAASNGLATVIRAWIDREAVATALGLGHDQEVLLSQTIGFPKS
jgi:nitroreductase